MMSAPVVIYEYDPEWPAAFDAERDRLLAELWMWAVEIAHVGSTSVPGLAAKPIIDIAIGLRQLEDADFCIDSMQWLGYEYVQAYEELIPERRYFRLVTQWGTEVTATHHVHMVETSSAFWRDQIVFRDYLRDHPDEAYRYAELKLALAAQYGADREGYSYAKGEFVSEMLEKAAAQNYIQLTFQ